MIPATVRFSEKLASLAEHWSPRVVAELNDYQFKLAKLQGEFVWHRHDETDEAFIVLAGRMVIEFRGVEHRPVAERECSVLLVEPRGIVNTGNAGGVLTAPTDVWI